MEEQSQKSTALWIPIRHGGTIVGEANFGKGKTKAEINVTTRPKGGHFVTIQMGSVSHIGWDYFDFRYFIERYGFEPTFKA